MYFIGLYTFCTGLCNQLYALASGILTAKKLNHEKVIISNFSMDLMTHKTCPVDKILDLTETEKSLNMQFIVGEKGAAHTWSIENELSYIYILKCLHFRPEFYDIINNLTADFIDIQYVVHFRIEPDAIKHWSKQNKMSPEIFTAYLHDNYKKAIIEHIPKNSQILALTGATIDHPLLTTLNKDYKIVTIPDKRSLTLKYIGLEGREISAIIDLLMGIKCTGVFIGCHEIILKRGSTFSFILWTMMDRATKGVFMDLDAIQRPLQVWYK